MDLNKRKGGKLSVTDNGNGLPSTMAARRRCSALRRSSQAGRARPRVSYSTSGLRQSFLGRRLGLRRCGLSWPRESPTPAETRRRCTSCPATVSAVERPPSGTNVRWGPKLPLGTNPRRWEAPRSSALSSPEKKVTATRFGGSWKCRLTGGFHGEFAGGGWRAVHSGAVDEFWWAATQQGVRLCSPEWARDGELTAALFWRESERKERVDASTASGTSPWRSCTRWELTSGARSDVRAPNVDEALSPDGHIDELGSDSDTALIVWQSKFNDDYLPNQSELGDGVVDKVEVLTEFYNIVN